MLLLFLVFPILASILLWKRELQVTSLRVLLFWPRRFANTKSADQPARSSSLFSAFAIRFLQSMISELAIDSTSLANLCSLAGWFQIDLLGNLEDRFRHVNAHLYM